MLQDIRKSTQGTTAKVIIGLIVIAFAFWGVESILLGGSDSSVAEVNGETISPAEMQQAVNIEQRRLIAAMGDNFDPAMLEEQVVSQRAMQSLIARKLLLQSAMDMGLHVSDAQIGAVIGGMEQFQVEGQFSEQMYRALIGESGYSPASFKRAVYEDLMISQARTGLAASDFATPAELDLAAAIIEEQRDLRYLRLPLEQFQDVPAPAPADIEAYYDANQEAFRSPESVVVNYIELRREDFARPVDDQEIELAYQQEVSHGEYAAQSRVSHILLTRQADEDESAFDARVNEVASALAAGGDFAQLAGQYSDDAGSASAGGDLGFSSGDVFPEPMEAAIAALDVGEVSAPVATDAGTHLLKVTERREGEAPSLEELRPVLEQRLSMEDAEAELLRTVESLKDLSFNAENLEMPARELGLEIKRSEQITRAQSSGLFANANLLQTVFSDDVLNGALNSDVIELQPGQWVVVHLEEHRQPELLPLDAVRDQIVSTLNRERAQAAVQRAAETAVESLRAGESVEQLANSAGYEWQVDLGVTRRTSTLPPALARAAFRMRAPAQGEALVDMAAADNGDYYVYQLVRVTEGDLGSLPESEQAGLGRLVSGEYGQLVDSEYRQGLQASAEIEVM